MTDGTTRTNDEFESRLTTALREDYTTGAFPESEIERALWDTLAVSPRKSVWFGHSTARSLLAAAAAILVFIGGAEYGRHTAYPQGDPRTIAGATNRATVPDLPLAIQTSGSRYVATLAQLTEQAPDLSERQLRIGREVAVMALYAAAAELLRNDQEDVVLQETVRSLAAGTADFASIDYHQRPNGERR